MIPRYDADYRHNPNGRLVLAEDVQPYLEEAQKLRSLDNRARAIGTSLEALVSNAETEVMKDAVSVTELKRTAAALLPDYVIDADWVKPINGRTHIPKAMAASTLVSVLSYANGRLKSNV